MTKTRVVIKGRRDLGVQWMYRQCTEQLINLQTELHLAADIHAMQERKTQVRKNRMAELHGRFYSGTESVH